MHNALSALNSMKTLSRQALRQHYRQYRQGLSAEVQYQASDKLLKTAFDNQLFQSARKVACYIANDGELSLMPIIEALWQSGVELYLPVLHPFTPGYLLFLRYDKETIMVNNRFGIEEPALDIRNMVLPEALDCILTPLVAFDEMGNRLGMGGGFYDRTLSSVLSSVQGHGPRLVGVAHEGQKAEQLPYQGWDIPMQAILTPERLLSITS